MSDHEEITARDRAKGWGIVLMICGSILLYGAIVFVTIGDKGPRPFNYGGVDFVPGGSPYSTDTEPIDMNKWKP